jgi:AcrR family transcriptional regulator
MGAQTNTRSRIQEIAIRLFTERGYEATSLREIAEELGFTKAALYYHFKTKEEIVESLIDDRAKRLDELIEWAVGQPRTEETRQEIVRRYAADMTEGRHHQVMRFMERNQAAMHGITKISSMRERMGTLVELLYDPDDPLHIKLKRAMSIFAMHAVWFILQKDEVSEAERGEAALRVALELIDKPAG